MRFSAFVFLTFLAVFPAVCQPVQGRPFLVSSPDKRVAAELTATAGVLRYRVIMDGQQIVAPSTLGILSNGIELGQEVRLGSPKLRAVHESYRLFGAHTMALNDANEATVPATSHGETYQVDIHVADDGVAVRLRLPAAPGRKVQADRSSWTLDGDPQMWVDAWDPGYESLYRTTSLSLLGTGALSLPITAKLNGVYATLTEAALKDYGDLALQPGPGGKLEGKLLNDAGGWTTSDAVTQPWRVTILGRDLSTLVNSTLVQNLNEPPRPELVDASWIKPGRSTWQWLAIGTPLQQDQRQWVDWTAQLGFEYYLIDEGWEHWTDPWASIASISAYAKQHNVKVWIWAHSREVKDPAQREAYFQKAVAAGVAGVKIDFPPPTDRPWSNWYPDTARDAAGHHLLVDFHGATKPTGMERTWPNAITREGVRGHEYQITRYKRLLPPEHDTILPFTRYVVGPGDYTPTVFEAKELQGNTWGHELAQAILFTSPFLCFGGHPQDFLANPARDVLTAIPSVWDETRVLPGTEPGKIAAMARRSGDHWFIAVINGGDASALDVSLSFLGGGSWKAKELFDHEGKPDAWDRKTEDVTSSGRISLHLAARGGFVAEISR